MNLKAGLWNNVDIQFVFDPYVHAQLDDLVAKRKETASGFADFQTRLKFNLWGNDGGKTALAIMPFVKWPLPASGLRNGQTEGGVIFPLAIELPADWSMAVMTEYDFGRYWRGWLRHRLRELHYVQPRSHRWRAWRLHRVFLRGQ